jgi:hypothetical protein
MKYCPKCSKTYDDSWKVCLNDGATLQDGQPTSAYSAPHQPSAKEIVKETYRFSLYLKLLFILPALLLGAFLMFSEVRKIYVREGDIVKALISYQGILLLLVPVAFIVILRLIIKYPGGMRKGQ